MSGRGSATSLKRHTTQRSVPRRSQQATRLPARVVIEGELEIPPRDGNCIYDLIEGA